jgi:hypothetical protein
MDFEGGILVGQSAILFPSGQLRNTVQWHCIDPSDGRSAVNVLRNCQGRICGTDIESLASCRTFLGCYRCVDVLLGANSLFQKTTIRSSDWMPSKSRIELAREGTTSLGLTMKGIVNGTLCGKWTLPKGLQVALSDNRVYDDRLEKAVDQPILLYDGDTQTS